MARHNYVKLQYLKTYGIRTTVYIHIYEKPAIQLASFGGRSRLPHLMIHLYIPMNADLMEDVLGLISWVIFVKRDKELGQGLRLQLAALIAMRRNIRYLHNQRYDRWTTYTCEVKYSDMCSSMGVLHGFAPLSSGQMRLVQGWALICSSKFHLVCTDKWAKD